MTNRTVAVLKANIVRNLRIDWKYKLNFVTDLAWLAVDVITFLFLGQMVASSDIDGFLYEGFLKEFLVVGVLYWVIFTRAYKDGVSVIPNEAQRGALGFIITNDVSISDLINGQFSSSTIKTSVTLIVFVIPIVALLSIIPMGETTILQPLFLSAEILVFTLLILIISWIFMLGITILASTLNVIFKKSGPLTFLLSYLVTMLSGYFFPLEVLRTFGLGSIEEILYLIPTTAMLYSLRSMLILGPGNYDPLVIIITIVINGIIAVFALIIALLIMRKTTRKAAYSGTLEFY
ncbi:MAG: hypothetical protein ACXADY_19535 [Candidatus Hodarchaeales archaeon]|jgi:ABC-type polysaccharide/polyol phosphate export permease